MDEENSYDLLYKIVIIGDTNVGKSNILSRYLTNEFTSNTKSTVGVELGIKFLKIKNTSTKIQIWDTAGQERYQAITSSYFRGSDGCFIVYDITNETSFNNIEKWFDKIHEENDKEIPVIIVGNKCDLENERKIPTEKAKEKAQNLKCAFYETSALKAINIEQIFEELVNTIYDKTGGNKSDDDIHIEIVNENKGVNINSENNEENGDNNKKGCCNF
jgi:Ras-related protein Rab-11A